MFLPSSMTRKVWRIEYDDLKSVCVRDDLYIDITLGNITYLVTLIFLA